MIKTGFYSYDCHSDGPLAQPQEVVMARVALCDVRGLLIDTIEKLSGEDGTEWAERIKSALRKDDLLRRVTEVAVTAIKKFVAADNFKVGNVGIVYLGDNFKTNFLGKIEKNVTNSILIVSRLEKDSLDKDIRDEVGSDKEETYLAHLSELLTRQSKGESGVLLTNGYANIFYIRDAIGNVWAVGVRWYSFYRGWVVSAHSVSFPSRWHDDNQVFSRK